MKRSASPIACDPAAHAEATPKFGPCAPSSMPMMPEAVLPSSAGMQKGEIFLPLSSASVCFSNVSIPPNAEPTITPNRDLSIPLRSRPESSTHIAEAATARCVYRSTERTVLALAKYSLGSKFFTCEQHGVRRVRRIRATCKPLAVCAHATLGEPAIAAACAVRASHWQFTHFGADGCGKFAGVERADLIDSALACQ